MTKTEPRILKGFRDYTPEVMRVRHFLMGTLRELFERYGFQPLDTPLLEYADILTGKYGDEGEQLLYRFRDHGDRDVALRYDLTIPFARFMAMHQEIPLPFRRYHMGPVFRADKPQHGRFREFWQCDADIAGATSFMAEVELLSLAYDFFQAIGLEHFTIRINDRRLLTALLRSYGFNDLVHADILRSIDKLDKIGAAGVEKELVQKGYPIEHTTDFLSILTMEVTITETLAMLQDKVDVTQEVQEALNTIEGIFATLKERATSGFALDLSLARGLLYYDGPVFEAVVEKPQIGSILGGGRYNGLVGIFRGTSIPATGISFGFERIVTVLQELGLHTAQSNSAQILASVFSRETAPYTFAQAASLRAQGFAVEVYPEVGVKIGKQLAYADKQNIPIVLLAGPDEVAREQITLKHLQEGKQETIGKMEMTRILQEWSL